jgi:hypothetical protein
MCRRAIVTIAQRSDDVAAWYQVRAIAGTCRVRVVFVELCVRYNATAERATEAANEALIAARVRAQRRTRSSPLLHLSCICVASHSQTPLKRRSDLNFLKFVEYLILLLY